MKDVVAIESKNEQLIIPAKGVGHSTTNFSIVTKWMRIFLGKTIRLVKLQLFFFNKWLHTRAHTPWTHITLVPTWSICYYTTRQLATIIVEESQIIELLLQKHDSYCNSAFLLHVSIYFNSLKYVLTFCKDVL